MTLDAALFTVLATLIASSAVGVVVSATIVRSAVFLLFTLIGVAFLYFLLGAEFLGATQLIVYVGGTLVLLVFGGMLTAGGPFTVMKIKTVEKLLGGGIAAVLFVLLVTISLQLGQVPTAVGDVPGPGPLGVAFLTSHLLPFEIVSVHLLVVLVGAAYLARAKRNPFSRDAEALRSGARAATALALRSEDSASRLNDGGNP